MDSQLMKESSLPHLWPLATDAPFNRFIGAGEGRSLLRSSSIPPLRRSGLCKLIFSMEPQHCPLNFAEEGESAPVGP